MDFWQWHVGPDLPIRLKPVLLVHQQLHAFGMIDTSTKYVDENAFRRHIVSTCHFIDTHIGHVHTPFWHVLCGLWIASLLRASQ